MARAPRRRPALGAPTSPSLAAVLAAVRALEAPRSRVGDPAPRAPRPVAGDAGHRVDDPAPDNLEAPRGGDPAPGSPRPVAGTLARERGGGAYASPAPDAPTPAPSAPRPVAGTPPSGAPHPVAVLEAPRVGAAVPRVGDVDGVRALERAALATSLAVGRVAPVPGSRGAVGAWYREMETRAA